MNKSLIFWIVLGFAQSMFGKDVNIANSLGKIDILTQNIKDIEMTENEINIWKLFREEFKDGDEVIIVHENCKLYGGKLRAFYDYCTIGGKRYPWSEIVFIAHSGFPVRTLHTCMSNEQLDEIENEDSIILMRKLLTRKPSEKVIMKTAESSITPIRRRYGSGCGFGCPFQMEDVRMQIINPFGKRLDFEETLVCQSKDGAVGLLWDIEDEVIEFYN